MTTIAMTLRPRRKRTRSDRIEQDGNDAEQHEQDDGRSGKDMEVDAAAGKRTVDDKIDRWESS